MIQTLNSILEALMTISVKGTDTITMSNVLQALQQVINEMAKQDVQSQQQFIPEEKEAE